MNRFTHLAILSLAGLSIAANDIDDKAYLEEIAKWRADRETSLRTPEGWLAVDGLFWLSEGDNTVGSAPGSKVLLPADSAPAKFGTLTLREGKIDLWLEPGVVATINGTAAASQELKTDAKGPADKVKVGDAVFRVLSRGKRFGVRLHNPNCKNRLEFPGRKWYDADPKLRIVADFKAHNPPKTIMITDILGDVSPRENPGYVEFSLGGKTHRLETETSGDELFINFQDKTSGKGTYPAGRYLYAPKAVDGKVVVDFNKAYSPPCAFTDYATCPLPPKGNRLDVEVKAGELYVERH